MNRYNRHITTALCIYLVYGLVFSCSSLPGSSNCPGYKTGSFSYHFPLRNTTYFFILQRNDSLQTEINEKTGDTATYMIRWPEPCTYELQFLYGTELLPDSLLQLKKNTTLSSTITGGTKDYYLFSSTTNLTSAVLQDTIWINH
jgi:hypothetical protein